MSAVKCGAVVVAGGVWSSQFLGNLGVRFPQLAVVTSAQCTQPGETPLTPSLTGSGFITRKRELGDRGVATLRIGGNIRWSNTDGFVSLLEQGFPVRAERHADRVVLHSL